MMRTRELLSLLAACATVGACDTRVNVDAAANASAQFSSVLVTVDEVWLNENATAAPEDGDWLKFPLAQPRTLELVEVDDDAVTELASELKVEPGTYHQIRLLLVDRGEPLTESARMAGATFNDQVTYFDANRVKTTVPLEVADAARGIGIETELVVQIPTDTVIAALAAASAPSNTRSSLTGVTPTQTTISGTTLQRTTVTNPFAPATPSTGTAAPIAAPTVGQPTVPSVDVPMTPGELLGNSPPGSSTTNPALTGGTPVVTPAPLTPIAPITPITPTTPTPTPTPPGSGGIDRTVTVTSSVFFDAARDLVAFRFSDRPGFVLNPRLVAFDLDKVGSIQAQLDVSSVAPNPDTGRPDVEVTAERLDEELGRRVEVASAPVRADGGFTLYPLPVDKQADDPTTYDLVIHGPAVTTVIIRGVPATEGAPDSSADVAFDTITLLASETYRVNLEAGGAVAPRGARVRFYQTLKDDAAPFLIDELPVDPLTGRFATDEPLSAAQVVMYGTFDTSFAVVAAAPTEGAARYSVAAFAPLYGNGDFASTPIAPPAALANTVAFNVPEVPIPSGATAGTIAANVNATTPGKYDSGALLVTHDGTIVTAAPLAAALGGAQPSTVNVANVPASASSEFERGLYYLEAWAWNSADPEGSFTRQPVTGAVDLRATSTASAEVTVN